MTKRATDDELAEEARKWDSGELKPTDPQFVDVVMVGGEWVECCIDPKCKSIVKIGVEVSGVYDGVLFWKCADCGKCRHRWIEPDMRARAEKYMHEYDRVK